MPHDFMPLSSIIWRAFCIALIVGPLLTFINQYNATAFDWLRFGLTICVPFVVSFASSMMGRTVALTAITDMQATYEKQIQAQEARIMQFAAVPRVDVAPVDNRRAAAARVVADIHVNAQNVNESSVERVQFITDLITRFEVIRENVTALQADADGAHLALDHVDACTGDISDGMHDVAQNAGALSDQVVHLSDLGATVGTHFADVEQATLTLSDLAAQIRLLAINASVEAAHVGDAGRGFHVIAVEVRALADKAARDVADIGTALAAFAMTQAQVTEQMNMLGKRLDENRDRADNCRHLSDVTLREIAKLSAQVRQFSADIATQLPQVLSLIDDVRQIKQNTQAAVTGSARNMALCDDVLACLTVQ